MSGTEQPQATELHPLELRQKLEEKKMVVLNRRLLEDIENLEREINACQALLRSVYLENRRLKQQLATQKKAVPRSRLHVAQCVFDPNEQRSRPPREDRRPCRSATPSSTRRHMKSPVYRATEKRLTQGEDMEVATQHDWQSIKAGRDKEVVLSHQKQQAKARRVTWADLQSPSPPTPGGTLNSAQSPGRKSGKRKFSFTKLCPHFLR